MQESRLTVKNAVFRITKSCNNIKNYSLTLFPKNDGKMSAFTLAEVLITLGIIGVVAALTIPTLIANHKKQVTVNKLKKAYSVVSQAVEKSKVDYGDFSEWDWDLSSDKFFEKYLIPNIQITKNCGFDEGCWSKGDNIFLLNGTGSESVSGYAKVRLSDGTFLALNNQNMHAHLYIDVNGEKEPNKYGIDCFVMTITKAPQLDDSDWAIKEMSSPGIYIFGQGYPRNTLTSNCKIGGDGRYCGALIMYDGWQMKDDYPGK